MKVGRTSAEIGGSDIVRLDTYPIDKWDGEPRRELVRSCREAIATQGYCVLPDFVTAEALDAMAEESRAAASSAYVSQIRTNVYFSRDDESLPPSHPKRHFMARTSAFVPADNIGPETTLRRLYDWPPFARFVAACLDEPVLYKYADPVADMPLNVVGPGQAFPWHFDTNEFSVSILTQAPEAGGIFEYAPAIRSTADENYDGVAKVLAGDRSPVRDLELNPGDLQIFKGRHALHRVTEVAGGRPRYTVIYSFAKQPGMVGRVERTRQLYGKVLTIHLEAEKQGPRGDRLED